MPLIHCNCLVLDTPDESRFLLTSFTAPSVMSVILGHRRELIPPSRICKVHWCLQIAKSIASIFRLAAEQRCPTQPSIMSRVEPKLPDWSRLIIQHQTGLRSDISCAKWVPYLLPNIGVCQTRQHLFLRNDNIICGTDRWIYLSGKWERIESVAGIQ